MATYALTLRFLIMSRLVNSIVLLVISSFTLFSQSKSNSCDSLIYFEKLEYSIVSIEGSTESIGEKRNRNLTCQEIIFLIQRRKESEDVIIHLDPYTEVTIYKKDK